MAGEAQYRGSWHVQHNVQTPHPGYAWVSNTTPKSRIIHIQNASRLGFAAHKLNHEGIVMQTMHATRLADWWSSLAMDWQAECQEWANWQQAGVMAALWYHLLVITPDSSYSLAKANIYTLQCGSWEPAFSPSYLFIFLFIIYLQ